MGSRHRFSMHARSDSHTGHRLVFGVWDRVIDVVLFERDGLNQEQAEFAAHVLNAANDLDTFRDDGATTPEGCEDPDDNHGEVPGA